MRTCSKCHIQKNEADFFVKDKKTMRLHSQCKECYKQHRKSFYAEHYAKYGDLYRQRAKIQRDNLRIEFRNNMLFLLKQSRCAICSESDIRVLEFDHLDPTKKLFGISQAVRLGYRWSDVEAEIKKCRVLCANCHKKHTASQSNWYKNVV